MSDFELSLAERAAQVPDVVTVRPEAVWREVRRRRAARRRTRAGVGAGVLAAAVLGTAALGGPVGAGAAPAVSAALPKDPAGGTVSALVDGALPYSASLDSGPGPSSGTTALSSGADPATTGAATSRGAAEALARALTRFGVHAVAVEPADDGALTVWSVGVLDATTRAAVERLAHDVVPGVRLSFRPGVPWAERDIAERDAAGVGP